MKDEVIRLFKSGFSIDFIVDYVYKFLNSTYIKKYSSLVNDTGLKFHSNKSNVRKFVISVILKEIKKVECSPYGFYLK